MNNEFLKIALAQTAEEKLLGNIPNNLPKVELSKKFKRRLNRIFQKRHKYIGFIAAAIAVVILSMPVIINQFKPVGELVERLNTTGNHNVSNQTTPTNTESMTITENNVFVNSTGGVTTTTSMIDPTTTVTTNSKEYKENMKEATKQYGVLKSIKDFDDYHIFYDENGRLNILYWEDESRELMENHLDNSIVIYKKVKFSNDYLLKIQRFLNDNMKEYGIGVVGSGDRYNQILIMISDESKKDDILALLYDNIENFDESAVRFELFDGKIMEQ